MDSRVLLAIDGNSLLHRSFHAQAHTGIRSVDGRPIWAVRGLLSQLVTAVDRVGPDAVLVGFDDPTSSLRRTQWPQYKAARNDKLETLVGQLALAADVLRAIGVAVVVPTGLEADDVLASAARFAPTRGATTVIMTSDRDAFALIDEHTRVLRIVNGGVEASPMLTAERLVMMLGIRPEQYRDFAALRGDASDNLPGVAGIGPKTAAKLLAALGSAQAAFDNLAGDGCRVVAAIGVAAARQLAHPDARAAWQLNCQAMTMHDDVPLGLDFAGGAGVLPFDGATVRSAFADHQLTWTTATALRVLARDEIGGAAPPRRTWSEPPGRGSPAPQRQPRLAAIGAKVEQ
ncbi:MAG: 5'-3' exonuclease H3TH domain-containing protein, partial [Actinomycetota bacterium]